MYTLDRTRGPTKRSPVNFVLKTQDERGGEYEISLDAVTRRASYSVYSTAMEMQPRAGSVAIQLILEDLGF